VSCKVSLYADDTFLYSEVNNTDDSKLFQHDIDQLYQWSLGWKMPFNVDKCEVMVFCKDNIVTPAYTLGGSKLRVVSEAKYLGIQLQSNLRFNKHIEKKVGSASKVLGCIKHSLYEAPEKCKVLAYTSLCRPILEYGDALWDPPDNATSDLIESVQKKAIRYIKNIKGRHGLTEAQTQLQLQTLKERRKAHRISLLMRILSDENKHSTLSSAYDEITNDRNNTTMTTRSATRGEPTSIYASSQVYFNSFLPRSVRDLRIGPSNNLF